MGADDYVPKPFNPRELIARIRAILRRTSRAEASAGPLVVGDLRIDPAVREVWLEDAPLNLTSAEFTLLEAFMREPGRVLSREQLTESVLGRKLGPFDRVIDVHVSNLRRKLGVPRKVSASRRFAAAGICSHRGRMQRAPIMRSLFLKIFFWFWATVIATGVALILTFIIEPRSVPSRWHETLTDTDRYSGTIAVETAEREGIGSASAYLERIAHETHMNACLFDSAGRVIAGAGCQDFLSMTSHVTASRASDFSMKYGIARAAFMLTGQSGRAYIFATELPAGPRAALGIDRAAVVLQWGVALLVSGLICSLLTRYLIAPILLLREMSQKLAAGDLSARAGLGLAQRRDEIGDLVRDFNAMASRIEELISRQRQLTSDVSHALRSPLARLNVALDLGRQRKGNDPAFEQMEEDIRLLDEMIGRLLTIAKLDIVGSPGTHDGSRSGRRSLPGRP